MMKYRDYSAAVIYDDEAEIFHGEVIGTRDIITFEGKTVNELKKAFRDSVEDYLEFCASRNETPEKPLSGKFVIRIPQELHWQLAVTARETGKSINKIITESLSDAVGARDSIGKAHRKRSVTETRRGRLVTA